MGTARISRMLPVNVVEALNRAAVLRRLVHKTGVVASIPLAGGSERLLNIAVKSHDILFRANTVFPFVLFPDTITIDREKLTIANRFFFKVAKITSVPIADILSVEADIGPFFGSVYLTSRYFFTNPRSVNFLRRKDALAMQRLLQGYIIAKERDIDCSSIEKDQLLAMLNDLGHGSTD